MEELYSATVLGFSVYLILWLFVIYSFLGVLVEMIFCLVQEGVLESRVGLLYLPLRPIYGVGGVACTVLLSPIHPGTNIDLPLGHGDLHCRCVRRQLRDGEGIQHRYLGLQRQGAEPPWQDLPAVLLLLGPARAASSVRARPIRLRSRGSVCRSGRRNCPYSADASRAAVAGGYPGRSGPDPQA